MYNRFYLPQLKNCILKKKAMNLFNILNLKYINFVYIYDNLLIYHHILSSNLLRRNLASNMKICQPCSPALILQNCLSPRISIRNAPIDHW